jgi:hypothetical protein
MTAIKPTILSDAQKDKQRPEDELYDALCREVATLRRLADSDNEGSNNNKGVKLQRASCSSLLKINRFLSETQRLRDELEVEGERVQRELAASLSRIVERTPR